VAFDQRASVASVAQPAVLARRQLLKRMQVRLDTASSPRITRRSKAAKASNKRPGDPYQRRLLASPLSPSVFTRPNPKRTSWLCPWSENRQFDIAPSRPVSGPAHQFCSPARIGGFFFHE
jgi:hypothetical protein